MAASELEPAWGCVLAGGASRRFGSDKAFADAGGVPRTVAVARLLASRSAGFRVFAVARTPGAFSAWGLASIVDPPEHAGAGPLAGLLAGLRHRVDRGGPGSLLVVACDVVDLDPGWIDLLPAPGTAAASVFRETAPPRSFQPLPGRYHTRLIPTLEEALAGDDRSFQRLLTAVDALTRAPPESLCRRAASGNFDHPARKWQD